MNKYLIIAASALALAGCSSDDFLGDGSGNGQNSANSMITFGGETGKILRANTDKTGVDAATLLDKNFVVVGFKGSKKDAANNENYAFDHYNVNYVDGTANTTESNTANWEYVNQKMEVRELVSLLQRRQNSRPSNIGTTLATLTTSSPSLWVRDILMQVPLLMPLRQK